MRLVRKRRLWKVYTKTKDYEHLQAYKIVESNVKNSCKKCQKTIRKENQPKIPKKILELSISILTEKSAIKVPLKVNDVFLDEYKYISKKSLVVSLQRKIY